MIIGKDKPTKLYDKIKLLLIQEPALRDSDKLLQWRIWAQQGHVMNGSLSFESYMNCHLTHPEYVRRTRQKVQADHPELRSSQRIQEYKDKRRKSKGTFPYREQFKVVKYEGNICYIE